MQTKIWSTKPKETILPKNKLTLNYSSFVIGDLDDARYFPKFTFPSGNFPNLQYPKQ